MRQGNVQGVTTDKVYDREWNSNDLKNERSERKQEVLEPSSQTSTEAEVIKQSADEATVVGLNKDSSEAFNEVSYPYSNWLASSIPPLSTPYIAPPSPYMATPYYYPMLPAAGVISPGVPLSNYPFTLEMAIVHQIEYYLGEENLAKDVYLRQLMDPEMWVEIEKLVTFPKLSRLTTSVRLVARVLREFSFRVQVHDDDERVRPTPSDSDEDRRLVIVKNVSGNVSKEDFLNHIRKEVGESVTLKILSNMEETWFVYCEDENVANHLCSLLTSLSFHGNILEARRKIDEPLRHSGEGALEFSKSNRHTAFAMMTPNSWATPSPLSSFSSPSFGNSTYVPMNPGFYPYPFTPYMLPLNAGITDTSRNARTRRRGNNRGLRGNVEKEQSRINENDKISENKTESAGQTSTKFFTRGHVQEKNLKEKDASEGQVVLMNGNVSSGTDSKEGTNHKSRLLRSVSDKFSNNSKGKNGNEPNLSLAEFPPLPSTNGVKLESLFKSFKGGLNSTNNNEGVEVCDNESEALNTRETKVFSERDSNISSFEDSAISTETDTEKASLPVLSFGDLVLTTENLSESDIHESL